MVPFLLSEMKKFCICDRIDYGVQISLEHD